MRFRLPFGALALLSLALLPVTGSRTAPVQPHYTVTDLGTLGGVESDAASVNDRGVATGWAATGRLDSSGNPIHHAYRWQDGQMLDLDTDANASSEGRGINRSGTIVGVVLMRPFQNAFRWTEQAGKQLLKGPPTFGLRMDGVSEANAVNASGIVAGQYTDGKTEPCASRWNKRHDTIFRTSQSSDAYAISRGGVMVGGLDDAYTYKATVWVGNSEHELPTPGADPKDFDSRASVALGINDREQIVGSSTRAGAPDEGQQACMWARGRFVHLGALPGDDFSQANAVNNRGAVVGESTDSSFSPDFSHTRAFLWTAEAGLLDLNHSIDAASGWVLWRARSINNRGQIVGTGLHNGVRRGFLLTPQ